MKKIFKKLSYWNFLLLVLSTLSKATLAQPAGSPVFTRSHKEFSVSLNGGYVSKNIYGIKNNSSRILLKTVLGLAGFWDIFAEAGIAKVTLVTPDKSLSNLVGKYKLAYGGGISVRVFDFPRYRFSFFTQGQVFRFTANPSSEQLKTIGGSEVSQILEFQYDWREAQFNAGITKGLGNAIIYSGANVKIIQRLETKIAKLVVPEVGESEAKQKGEYLSGLEINPFIGVDFNLPSRFKFSFEIIGQNSSDLTIYIGISQTGKP